MATYLLDQVVLQQIWATNILWRIPHEIIRQLSFYHDFMRNSSLFTWPGPLATDFPSGQQPYSNVWQGQPEYPGHWWVEEFQGKHFLSCPKWTKKWTHCNWFLYIYYVFHLFLVLLLLQIISRCICKDPETIKKVQINPQVLK